MAGAVNFMVGVRPELKGNSINFTVYLMSMAVPQAGSVSDLGGSEGSLSLKYTSVVVDGLCQVEKLRSLT